MSLYGKRLSAISLVLLGVMVFAGCSQPDDILTGVSKSTMTLTAERLPTPPNGMVYELWLSKVADPDTSVASTDIRSLGKFSYINNDTINAFLNLDGSARSNLIDISEDILNYKSVFVSIELASDADEDRPGPIMLTGRISSDPDATLRLNFPKADSLFEATCWFNMHTTSDESDGGIGRGIWFCGFRAETKSLPDTIALRADSTQWDTLPIEIDPTSGDTTNIDSLTRPYPDVLDSIYLDTVYFRFQGPSYTVRDTFIMGVDSFEHIRMHYKIVYRKDTIPPYTRRNLRITVDTIPDSARLQIFNQQQFAFPIVTKYGWKYCGWVVEPSLDITKDSIGSFTPPGYPTITGNKNWFSGSTGGLLSTGTFTYIDSSDDLNRFQADANRIPGYPGEEYVDLIKVQDVLGVPEVNFLPNATGNVGNVFISFEPANRLTDTTNFPLIAFSVDVPSFRSALNPVGNPGTVQIRMYNLTGSVPGYLNMGFPEISAKIGRF